MIHGPHQSTDDSDSCETDHLRQLRHKKTAPANFFPERP